MTPDSAMNSEKAEMGIPKNRLAVLTLTKGGNLLGEKIAANLEADLFFCRGKLKETVHRVWGNYSGLIFIMASGIVIRLLAPLIKDKSSDPAILVCDEKGNFIISLLSGHLGGANELALRVSEITGGQAVITTTSDVLNHTAVDIWARDRDLHVAAKKDLTTVMGKLVNNGSLSLYSDYPLVNIPADFRLVDTPEKADLIISCRTNFKPDGALLHPRILVAGMGCNRGTGVASFEKALKATCEKHHLAMKSIVKLASIDLKQDEQGLLEFARKNGYAIDFFNRDQLNTVPDISISEAVMKAVGAKGVAEPAAILAAKNGKLVVRKEKWTDVTVAIAEAPWPWSVSARDQQTT